MSTVALVRARQADNISAVGENGNEELIATGTFVSCHLAGTLRLLLIEASTLTGTHAHGTEALRVQSLWQDLRKARCADVRLP